MFQEPNAAEAVDRIIEKNKYLLDVWGNCYGWAPTQAAKLLDESRVDWLVSLSHTLRVWVNDLPNAEDHDGRLILAWANLGSLAEGTMKFFLSIYHHDYEDSVQRGKTSPKSIYERLWRKNQKPDEVDGLMFDHLREFFKAEIWRDSQREWDSWLSSVQQKRNAIHAYRRRDIGSFDEFKANVVKYHEFLDMLAGQLPDEPPSPEYYR